MTEELSISPYPDWYIMVDNKGVIHHLPSWKYIKEIQEKADMHNELVSSAFWMFDLIRCAGIGIDRFEYQKLKEIQNLLNRATKEEG